MGECFLYNLRGGGINLQLYTFTQERVEVTNFLSNVTYDPTDYTTTQINNYVTTTGANWPEGITINMKSAGTLTVIDGYTGNLIIEQVAAGNKTIYNCTPGVISYFVLTGSDGTIIQEGYIKPTGTCRMIRMPNADNVRDLGGWACDGGKVKYGKLFRGGEMYGYLTEEGKRQALQMMGILKEIDLRFSEDLNGRTESGFGPTVDMLHVDMTWGGLEFQKTSGHIKAILDPLFDYVLAGKPTYFHCSAGADRTGVIALLVEGILGVSQSDCDKDYELTCFFTGLGDNARSREKTAWTREITYINKFAGTTFQEKIMNLLLSCGITLEKINAFRAAMIDGSPTTLTASLADYNITKTLTNVSVSNAATTVKQYQPFVTNIAPIDGKVMGNIKVTMGGVDITEAAFKGTAEVLHRNVTKSLTNCSSSNPRAYVIDGQSYVTTLSANSGYTINSVVITMGGTDISEYYKDGIISIPEVTGDIAITATTSGEETEIVNLIDTIGISANTRLSTGSGNNKPQNGWATMGANMDAASLIHITSGDTLRIKGVSLPAASDGSYTAVVEYSASATTTFATYIWDGCTVHGTTYKNTTDGIIATHQADSYGGYTEKYMRLSLPCTDASAVIMTINQEIS